MIDIHCHLTFGQLNEVKDDVVAEARKSMYALITCGLSRDYKEALGLGERNDGFVYISLGLHPEDVVNMTDEQVGKDLEFIRKNSDRIVAIGEIGLDYHWVKDSAQNSRCRKFFVECLDAAKDAGLPVVLHSRNAEEDVFAILIENNVKNAVFHHYSGSMTLAEKILDAGYYISIPTIVGTSKNLRKIVRNHPLERLMTETDSPFNSPTKDRINYPYNVRLTLEKIAELRRMPLEDVDRQTTENAKRFFNL